MEESLITIPISFFVWLIIVAIVCLCMLVVQTCFVLHDIKIEKKKEEE